MSTSKERDNLIEQSIKDIIDGTTPANDILCRANDTISDIEKAYVRMRLEEHYARMGMTKENELPTEDEIEKTDIPVLTWGSHMADLKFSPIEPHFFIIMAGAQGSGKTAWTFHVAVENARTNPVLYVSLEMTRSQIITRAARAFAGITQAEWRDRTTIPAEKREKYFEKRKEMEGYKNLFFSSPTERTIDDVLRTIRESAPKLAIIDNLDLIEKPANVKQLDHEAMVSQRIMQFTSEYNIPIILIHHLNKHGRGGDINAIRGSGKLTDDADMVLMGCREEGEDLSPEQRSRFIVAVKKDRSFGYGGIHTFHFNKGNFADTYSGPIQIDSKPNQDINGLF